MATPNKPPSRRGQKGKLTPAVHDVIVRAVAAGVPFMTACALADVTARTGLDWIRRGNGTAPRHRGPYQVKFVLFANAVEKAKAQDRARRIARINQAGQGGFVTYEKTTTFPDGRVVHEERRAEPQWTADAWHLERTEPENWGRRDRLDLRMTIEKAAKKVAEDEGMTVEEVMAEAEAYLQELDHGGSA